MTKGSKTLRKAAASSAYEMPLAERRKRIATLCGEVSAFWNGQPNTGAVAHLIQMRRGKA